VQGRSARLCHFSFIKCKPAAHCERTAEAYQQSLLAKLGIPTGRDRDWPSGMEIPRRDRDMAKVQGSFDSARPFADEWPGYAQDDTRRVNPVERGVRARRTEVNIGR
jgi:hypothetical protein